ncbi:MAG TPA: LPS assembly protein LptD [Steroidobacteraceae bacterium]|nr:LPS assembly protein LptD [Steroidobacteraceae bacterium]
MRRPDHHLTRNNKRVRARVLFALPLAALSTNLAQAQECPASSRDTPLAHHQAPVWDSSASLNDDVKVTSQGAEVALKDGSYSLNGHVNIEQGERKLTAEDAHYDPATGQFKVRDSVKYTDPEIEVEGTDAEYDSDGRVSFENAQFRLKTRAARGSAKGIEVNEKREVHLDQVQYTSCPPGKNDWLITASDIDIYQDQGAGYGRGVRLDFKGVPILYAPVISFPVGNERKSGFLFPTFGTTSRSGTELGVPWYWNIAPNYDATFVPTYYSSRGARLDTELRYLTNIGEGKFNANYLPNDRRRDQSRSLLTWQDTSDFTRNLRLQIDAANASDQDWFEDFGSGPEGTSVTYLGRSTSLTYLDDVWRITALAQNFQTIDESIPRDLRPYTLGPQLGVSARLPQSAYGLSFDFDGELTNFTRHDGLTGMRLDLAPQVRLPLERPGYYVEPAVSWRYTTYDLTDEPAGTDSTPSRTLPEYSVDAGLTFERLWGSRHQRLQTLEPRVRYLYVPYRRQADLPVFDTHPADLNLVQLFRSNRYMGLDRISDANQLSFGLTSRLFDAADGRQFISATVGQAVYFKEQRTVLPGETLEDSENSDIIGELDVTAFQHWNVRLGTQWDPGEMRSEKGDAMLQYSPDPDRVVNLGYRFRRKPTIDLQQIESQRIEQLDGSFAWPIARSWSLYARWVYSLEDKSTIDRFAGVEYRSCCWGLRVVTRRYLRNREGDYESSILLQLELNGLSNVGQEADAFLERSIRGYSPRPELP